MNTPAQTYINWFKSLAVHQRMDVSFMVGGHITGGPIDVTMDANSMEDKFVTWIEKISASNALLHAAAIVSLIAVTELLIIRKRGTSEHWAHSKAMLTELAQKSETFAQQATEVEFRGRQWIAACDEWKTARKGSLSESFIENWMEQNSLFNKM